jgi:hypothetical protein
MNKGEQYSKQKLEDLINAGKSAVEILLEEIQKPLDVELSDEKRRNAIKAKKECFIDCQEILLSIKELEVKIYGTDENELLKREADFEASFAERRAKR